MVVGELFCYIGILGDVPLNAVLTKLLRLHVAWAGLAAHSAEHLTAWGRGKWSFRGRLGCVHIIVHI